METRDVLAATATVAGILMAISPLLQVRRMLRTRSTNDVSLLYLAMLCVGFLAWLAYGYILANAAMLISNTASLVFMLFTIGVALSFRRGGARRAAAGAAATARAQPAIVDKAPVEDA